MSAALYWLVLCVIMTLLMWVPYVLNRASVRGLMTAMGNPSADDAPHAAWADRAMRAHRNMVENLIPFASVVLIAEILQKSDTFVATWAAVFFFARLAHYVIYTIGIPVLRTLAFAVSMIAILAIALRLLGVV